MKDDPLFKRIMETTLTGIKTGCRINSCGTRLVGLVTALTMIIVLPVFVWADKMHGTQANETSLIKKGKVPLLEDLYALNFPVTTGSPKARAYFNQGLVLTYGFDHSDAEASFLEAAKHDPKMAMAYWGVAFVLGPNINASMDPANGPRAYEMVRKALTLADNASEKEKDLIKALSKRYSPDQVEDRTFLDKAFAEAMELVYRKHPHDPDVAVLYAESLMDLHPWDYWTADDRARPWTPALRRILERAVHEHPRHPHPHHLYIHLMENSPTPEVAVPSADIILNLVPASGHLVHMAGHAYYAAGFYNDCSRSNEKALGVDKMLLTAFDTQGLYQLGYMPHVLHYLLASYMMEGRSAEAIQAARTLSEGIDPQMMRTPGMEGLQHYYTAPYYTLVRFGQWETILEEPMPAEDLIYPRAMLHYARGMALVRTADPEGAQEELAALIRLSRSPALESVVIWEINKSSDLLAIAADVLAGEIEAVQGNWRSAVEHLESGVANEMNLRFDEPPPWYFPVRQALGTVLLEAGQYKRAETVFRKDLLKNADNPWSLYGLALTYQKTGQADLGKEALKRFSKAWARADIEMRRPIF